MRLKFLGATGTVTGSKYLVTIDQQNILVDCGLFQGYKELRLRNWAPLPIDATEIDSVVITHAHIDHTGYLPLLVKKGFTGPIYATEATCDLCSILLPDSGHLQEEYALRANKYGYTKHAPALPLYTQLDAEKALKQLKVVDFKQHYPLFNNGHVAWHPAGHIIGAALIEFNVNGKKLVFSGDLGRLHDPIMKPPYLLEEADYLVVESTYGNRQHSTEDPESCLEKVINQTLKRGGNIIIPAFAVGRAQSVMYYIAQLKQQQRIPHVPVYLDSPMAINATEILQKHISEHRLSSEQCQQACGIATYTRTAEESKAIVQKIMPKIIISASGMMTGGRILHHLKAFAPDPRNTILMTGFQAGGTRGARLLDGERELKIHGEMVPIKAQVEYLSNMSAHADYTEILSWLGQIKRAPQKVFITHGEPEAANSLKVKIETQLGWHCEVPNYLDEVNL